MSCNPFEIGGLWVKCCFHAHSTNSDGALTPVEVVKFYREKGFRVVSITDHNKLTLVKCPYSDVIFVPGIEVDVGKSLSGHSFHFIVLGLEDVEIPRAVRFLGRFFTSKIEDFLRSVEERGGVVFLAHPSWSSLSTEDLLAFKNYIGIEVYNTGCDLEVAKGFSTAHWDQVLSRGRLLYGFAVDDAHRYHIFPDAGGAWTCVKISSREEFTADAVVRALRRGLFYSSMGPEIKCFKCESGEVAVKVTPVERVNFMSDNGSGFSVSMNLLKSLLSLPRDQLLRVVDDFDLSEENGVKKVFARLGKHAEVMIEYSDDGITGVVLKGYKFERYLRVEVVDKFQRYAWTNPVLLA